MKHVNHILICATFALLATCTTLPEHVRNGTSSVDLTTLRLDFHPAFIEGLAMDSEVNVTVHSNRTMRLRVDVVDKSIAEIFDVFESENSLQFRVKGTFLGRTHIDVSYFNEETGKWEPHSHYKVSVIRPPSVLDRVFLGAVILLMICINIGMGCTIDLTVVKLVLRRPTASAIGFFCQFCVMPLVAYSLVRLLDLQGGVALGLFAAGCAPGGGASNVYTYLLGGDVNLSVTMTLVSTLASFAMIPLWLFTLGTTILNSESDDIKIPFFNIVSSLIGLLLPIGLGIYLQARRAKLAERIVRWLKPVFVGFIIFMFSFGIYTNLYIIYVISKEVVIGACLMPYIGFTVGAILATICKQPRSRIIAIALETGIQNTGIPIILLRYSLPQPEADLSVVSSVVVASVTPIPLWIALGILELRKHYSSSSSAEYKPDVVATNCPVTQGVYAVKDAEGLQLQDDDDDDDLEDVDDDLDAKNNDTTTTTVCGANNSSTTGANTDTDRV